MSRETLQWLNQNTLIGYTEKRGHAWHYREGSDNHFEGPVPAERVRRLFGFEALESSVKYDTVVDGQLVTVIDPDHKLYYRSDTLSVLGIHGTGHKPHQYCEWLMNNVEILLGNELAYGQAGLLRGGAVAWVSIEMAETMSTYTGISYRPQLLAATSFDASLQTTNKLVSTIAVCDNTLAGALGEKSDAYKVKHSSKSKFDEDKARETLGLVEAYGEAFGAGLNKLVETPVTRQEWEKFLQLYIPMPKEKGRAKTLATQKRDIFDDLWNNDPRVSPWRGTEFGVLQAANTWLHHHSTVQGATRPERNAWRAVTANKAQSIEHFDREVLATLAKSL